MQGMSGSLGACHPGELIVKLRVVALASVLLLGSGLVTATTLTGDHFTVTFTTAAQGLFDNPSMSAPDVLSWTPAAFQTDSDSGTLTSSSFVTITADAGWNLKKFSFAEAGNYFGGTITDAGSSTIGIMADGYAKVTPLTPAASTVQSNFSSGTITTATFDVPSNMDNGFGYWGLTAAPIMLNGGVTQVKFTAVNNIYAWASANGFSQIQKTAADLKIETVTAVPEPETYAMMLAGLGALGFLAFRRGRD